jgi:hypothetical protein
MWHLTPFIRALSLILLLLLSCFSALAQPIDACEDRSLIVNVFEQYGQPIQNLQPRDFNVKEGRRSVEPIGAKYTLQPRRIVIVLDTSGSMSGERGSNKWLVARTATEALLSMASPQVPIALIAFSDNLTATFSFGTQRAEILRWLTRAEEKDSKIIHGHTALFDAIGTAEKMLEPSSEGDVIYAITDDEDNHSVTRGAKLERLLLEKRVRLFMFKLADRTPPLAEGDNRSLTDISIKTGGFVFGESSSEIPWARNRYDFGSAMKKEIEDETALLILQVAGFYKLDLGVAPPEGAHVSVRVLDGQNKRKNLLVTSPSRFWSCSAPLAAK